MWHRMNLFEEGLAENNRITNEVKTDTAELIEIAKAFKGASKVFSWFATLGKWIGWIGGGFLAAWGLWNAIKSGTPPAK